MFVSGEVIDKIITDTSLEFGRITTLNYDETGGRILNETDNKIVWKDIKIFPEKYEEMKKGYSEDYNVGAIDIEVIDLMAKYEDTIYRMISRSAYNTSNMYVIRKIYLNQLKFWNDYLTRNDVNLYIAGLAHNVVTYIPYCLCKERNIKTIIVKPFSLLNFPFYYISDDNIEDKTIVANALEGKYNFADFTNNKEMFENIYHRYVLKEGDTAQACIKKYAQLKYFVKSRTQGFLRVVRARKPYLMFFKAKEIIKGRTEYIFNELYIHGKYYKPKQEDRYILYAMHYQPEATTLPLAKSYVDQKLVIEAIAKSLPEGYLLYVKEHPNQKSGCGREAGFYKEILEHKNVRLIKRNVGTDTLIDKAIAIASITGTILLESSCKEKPTIMFGNGLYEMVPGVQKVYTLGSVKDALEKVLYGKIKISNHSLKRYFCMLSSFLILEEETDSLGREICKIIRDGCLWEPDINE